MSFSKAKGDRFERLIVESALAHDIDAHRVPLSGAVAAYPGDVILRDSTGERWMVEAKKRAEGFRQLYRWIARADIVVVGADRQPALAVLALDDFFEVLARKVSR